MSQEQFNKLMDSYIGEPQNIEKISNAMQRYFMRKQEQQQQAQMEEQFKNPQNIEIGESPVKGPADAKVTIVEFSEFQCPFCKQGAQTMAQVANAYPKDVKVVFKHFPLPAQMHPQARNAALASIAAQKQGKFWEMHDKLFENQPRLSPDLYNSLAQELGLDMAKFKADMEDPATAKRIEEDKAQGEKVGVRGTPGFFVNGVNLSGAQPFTAFQSMVDRWLEKLNK